MVRSAIILVVAILFSCNPSNPPSNLTLVDVTLNNIPLSNPNDTLEVRLSYFRASGPWGTISLNKDYEFVGTLNNHFIDTIFQPAQFDSGKFHWKLVNNAPVDSGFETFPIIPNTTKYILLNY